MGVVACDEKCKVISVSTHRVRTWWPSEIVESKALLFASKHAKRYGSDNIILESDNQILVSRLYRAVVYICI